MDRDKGNEEQAQDPVSKVEAKLRELREEVAERRPVAELIRYLLYFWAAASLVLGFFGWKQFSDLETTVGEQVRLQLPRDKSQFAEYEKLIAETEALYSSFEALTEDYTQKVEQLQYADVLSKDFDIEGRVLALQEEAQERAENKVRFDEDDPYEGTVLEAEWRARAIGVLREFRKVVDDRVYPADFIFNVAQTCRRLEQYQLVSELTEAAEKRDPAPPIRAMALSSKVAISSGEERDRAFSELMGMVRGLGIDNPHIVLAEAWNAAENERRYDELLESLDELIGTRKGDKSAFLPSYVFSIKAQALARKSGPDAAAEAIGAAQEAWRRVRGETPMAQWYPSTLNETVTVARVLEEGQQLPRLEDLAKGPAMPEPRPEDIERMLEELFGEREG